MRRRAKPDERAKDRVSPLGMIGFGLLSIGLGVAELVRSPVGQAITAALTPKRCTTIARPSGDRCVLDVGHPGDCSFLSEKKR